MSNLTPLNLLAYHNKKLCRFEYHLYGIYAQIDYSIGPETIVFHHSNLPEQIRQEVVPDMLIAYAIEYAREQHLKIIATCPEIRKYIRSHAWGFICVGKVFVAVD